MLNFMLIICLFKFVFLCEGIIKRFIFQAVRFTDTFMSCQNVMSWDSFINKAKPRTLMLNTYCNLILMLFDIKSFA